MPTTTKWGLRYPAAADAPNGPLNLQQLAEDVEAALPVSGTFAARPTPSAARVGAMYYATDTAQLFVWIGAAWVEIASGAGIGAQPGDVKATARVTAPTGWIMCDGASLLRTDFAALFAAISTNYGAADGTHFNVPDLRGRVPVGVDGAAGRMATNDAIGQSGGAETHTLTGAESGTPAHTHTNGTLTVNSNNIGQTAGWNVAVGSSSFGNYQGAVGDTLASQTNVAKNIVTALSGSSVSYDPGSHNHSLSGAIANAVAANASQAHNMMQPYLIMNWVIKT